MKTKKKLVFLMSLAALLPALFGQISVVASQKEGNWAKHSTEVGKTECELRGAKKVIVAEATNITPKAHKEAQVVK